MNKKVPILVLAFNRPDHVAKSMEAIREYQPDKLYLECDGARTHKGGERKAVEETRKAMLDSVDWPCEVKTLFREENLGCANAVYGAISWFFENEEYGCIIEDDIVVSQDFFRLCEDLLPRYKDEERIMEIGARNHRPNINKANTYVYTNGFHIWGWATWRRAWHKMDMNMKNWPRISIGHLWGKFGMFKGSMMYYYWKDCYKHLEENTSWGTRWYFCVTFHNGLVLIPCVNLAINVGVDGGGTHYDEGDIDPYAYLCLQTISWPLAYNDTFEFDKHQLKVEKEDFLYIRKLGLKKKIKKIFYRGC
ncbi:MAG: hemolysin hemolytic protein [Prevotellaceae bacterium]|nr:hemolysin hemolytic protein [Candidatus Faecinaster equi]MBQ0165319.1 hemolysin hemolytic protein [Candidatus Equimonas faecalis]